MEPRKKPNDPNDPKEYRPVKNGLYKLTVMFSTVMGITVLLAWWLLLPHFTAQLSTVESVRNVGLFLAWALVAVKFLHDPFADFVREYVAKSLRGYQLACWFGEKSASGDRSLCYRIVLPGEQLGEVKQPTILLPLGGWFRKPTVRMPQERDFPMRGKVRLVRLVSHDDFSSERAIAWSTVQLRDELGDRMTVSVYRALEIFEFHGLKILSYLDGGLRQAHVDVYHERDRAVSELAEVREAVDFIVDLHRQFEAASRLHDKLQALRIHERILTWFWDHGLGQRLDFDIGALARVRARLAEHEARDRRRHRRGPAATTGT